MPTPKSHAFDFDEEINRRAVPALKTHRIVIGEDGADLFAAGVADMDFKVAPVIQDALQARLAHGVFGYEALPDNFFPSVSGWLKRRHDWDVSPTHLVRSPNVLNAMAMAVSIFSAPGDGVIVQPPVFFDFFDIVKENNRSLLTNPLRLESGRYSMDIDNLEKLAAKPNTRILLLCNPHNPIGRAWTHNELCEVGEICGRHDVLVISDEIHGDLAHKGHVYTPFASLNEKFAANSVTCLSPAKTFNIASCCSAITLIPNETLRAQFQAENSRLTVNKNNAFANVAMTAAYSEGDTWLDAAKQYLNGNIALVRKSLDHIPEIQLIEPEASVLLWLDFRRMNLNPDALTKFVREEARWAITRGPAFGEGGTGFGRVNIACRRDVLAAALDQMQAAVARQRKGNI